MVALLPRSFVGSLPTAPKIIARRIIVQPTSRRETSARRRADPVRSSPAAILLTLPARVGAGGLVFDLGVGALLVVLCLPFVAAALFRRTIPKSSALWLVSGVSAPARCETARDLSCQCPREIGRGDR